MAEIFKVQIQFYRALCTQVNLSSSFTILLLFELDVSILLLLTNRHNKGILLHFCQQNGKKIAKIKFWTKLAGNGLK